MNCHRFSSLRLIASMVPLFREIIGNALFHVKMLGLVPFYSKHSENGILTRSWWTLYSICIFIISIALTYSFWHAPRGHMTLPHFSVSHFIKQCNFSIILFIHVTEVYLHRCRFSRCLVTMEAVHSKLSNLGAIPYYVIPKLGIFCNVAISTVLFVIDHIKEGFISKMFPTLMYFISDIQLSIVAYTVVTFLALVETLLKTLRHKLLTDAVSFRISLRNERFQQLSNCYSTLINCCTDINKIFNVQLLYIMSYHFINSCILISYFFTAFSLRTFGFIHLLYFAFGLFMTVNSIISVLIITNRCTSIEEEAKEFDTALYQLMIDDKTNVLITNPKLRLHIGMKREIIFTACDFFTLDYTLVHSMVASTTTYLVILIQYGQPSSSESLPATIAELGNITTKA